MSNRHERRKAAATSRKGLSKFKTTTLNRQLDETMRRVRAEFERGGEIDSRFECVADAPYARARENIAPHILTAPCSDRTRHLTDGREQGLPIARA